MSDGNTKGKTKVEEEILRRQWGRNIRKEYECI
jgi:hypothetical protein